MAYYTALVALWPSAVGADTATKLAWVNTQTAAAPAKSIVSTNDVLNAIVAADFLALTQLQLLQLQTIVANRASVDASSGTMIRTVFQNIFAGKTATLAALTALVAPNDNATVPWWKANGYPRPFDLGDLSTAGLS